jgi:hypothetical protein
MSPVITISDLEISLLANTYRYYVHHKISKEANGSEELTRTFKSTFSAY